LFIVCSELFSNKINDVIGIYLNDDFEILKEFEDVSQYILRIMKCILQGQNLSKIEIFNKQTINIFCPSDSTINWEITDEKKKELYDIGYKTVSIYEKNM
jgi:hypothetical protein